MDQQYFEEGSLAQQLPAPITYSKNQFFLHKGKLKSHPETEKINGIPLNKKPVCNNSINSSIKPPINCNIKEENLNNCKIEENIIKSLETKGKADSEKIDEKEIVLAEFGKSLKEIKEEDINKIFKGRPEFKSKYELALNSKNEVEKMLRMNLSKPALSDKGKYLKNECENHKKRTLVLEIQGVIQYISVISIKDFDFCIPAFKDDTFLFDMYIKNRKYLGEFLLTMSKYFELIIFSEMQDDTLISVTNFLEELFDIKFSYVIGSSHSFYKNNSIVVKNMNSLFENRLKEDVIIVDYNFNNSCFYLDNTIFVPQFIGKDEDENFLKYLAKFLLNKAI